ncbi:2Fe-2S ferredoxin [Roseivivax halodurans JCM 10272]|uniref:2Fe-2S ferredoxin n=1 Tax=Roseivivax halodurans JCM 10272 TaxID=1449350 RepID=X7EGG3_9RHOB|nr:DUF1284 domain-containing protein [Roseivivax halodurans]ETX15194.1 2Fe-2S ferredoxin [Roseivivax halodurans JCM 10272]
MTVRLRPHHLLCVLTYVGAGYTPAFTANMDRVVGRLSRREPVRIVAGPDDICVPLSSDPSAHCHGPRVRTRDRRAARDGTRHLGHPIVPGATFTLDAATLARLRRSFARGRVRSACTGCPWSALCTSVSRRAYPGTRLS